MLNQLHPLQLNLETGEPFLQLPSPHQQIFITVPRLEDRDDIFRIASLPSVQPWLGTTMSVEKAGIWSSRFVETTEKILKDIGTSEDRDARLILSACPVRSLRVRESDGGMVYIGDIGIQRCQWHEVDDEVERRALITANQSLPTGDPSIIWQLANFLSPEFHGRGIMTAAVRALITNWAIPRMNVNQIKLCVRQGNIGSVRVFEKNGFEFEKNVGELVVLAWRHERLRSDGHGSDCLEAVQSRNM